MPGQFTGIRGSAQEYISSLIGEGLTNAQIVGTLQDYGLGYRLQQMYSDTNRIRLEEFAAQGLKGFDQDTPIPANLMREWQGETDYRYRVVVEYEYETGTDGTIAKAGTTLYYDRPPTVNEVMEDWAVRVQSIESGVMGYEQVKQIEGVTRISYFYNIPKLAQ
jgi:hypothetical protein